jgi:hypothetical protein
MSATHYEDIPCLTECDERHAEGCPRFAAERDYWARYFGVGTPAFEAMAPLTNKWCPECQRTLKVSAAQRECPVCDRGELQ